MRTAFSDAIVAAARHDPKVLLLTGDHGYALFDAFRKACPDQYINCGIAEQNMVGVAAGLAKAGFRPIVYGLAAFVPIRVLEQIKIDVCYEALPVVLVGDGAGVVYSHLGSSHQSTEDISALRALPGLAIYSPADRHELSACMTAALGGKGPAYLRMGKADLGDVHAQDRLPQDVRRVQALGRPDSSLLLVATGSGVSLAQAAAHALGEGQVLSVPCLKPMDTEALIGHAAHRRTVVVIEEHAAAGGLGSIVAEALVGRFSGQFLRIGMEDRFSAHCGSYSYLMQEHGLGVDRIVERIRAAHEADAP